MGHHDVVAIGASAGGVEALSSIASSLPRAFPAVILVTLHLPRTAHSELDVILSKAGPLPARFARPGEKPEHGSIYIAPPDHHLLLIEGAFALGKGAPETSTRPAIDPMFRSVALCCGERSVGVVLTGTLGDGASGLWAIKSCGGQTVVQDPKDAAYAEMPFHAMDTVMPHHVLALCEVPRLLCKLVRLPTGKKVKPPASLAAEVGIARGAGGSMETPDQIAKPSLSAGWGGQRAMGEIRAERLVHDQCHVEKAFRPNAVGCLFDDNLRRAMASAVRALEERLVLMRRLERQAASTGHRLLRENWAGRAAEVQKELDILRGGISQLEDMSSGKQGI